jgi:hypothetical protein
MESRKNPRCCQQQCKGKITDNPAVINNLFGVFLKNFDCSPKNSALADENIMEYNLIIDGTNLVDEKAILTCAEFFSIFLSLTDFRSPTQ